MVAYNNKSTEGLFPVEVPTRHIPLFEGVLTAYATKFMLIKLRGVVT